MKTCINKTCSGRVVTAMVWMVLICLCLSPWSSLGQSKARRFKLPASATQADYRNGHVIVKLKTNHRDIFRSGNGRNAKAIPQQVGVTRVNEMMPGKAVMQGRIQKGPRRQRSTVDPGLYYRLDCDLGKNIEDFINELYLTGYFEVVEPDYIDHMTFQPNDPNKGSQYYLQTIKAFEAWDITQGDATVTIGIVDSGGDLVHEDLSANLYTNPLDPIDGIDNDNNGYLDDFNGWDFVGNDLNNLNDPNFLGDNNPQLFVTGVLGHGVNVAGCASASTNNGIGIAGVGFNTKIMWTKHSADTQPSNNGSIYAGYDGIFYAATRGMDIINCSWGGPFRSEIAQDFINFVTLDLGVLIVAAAGNDGVDDPFYPAAYDNVLSVSATNQSNTKASFSNYGSYVDIAAPGVAIFTTAINNQYTSTQGTSFSSPIVAGAAALVKAHFPSYTPQQIAEQLRVTSNSALLNTANPAFIGRMGHGILDIQAALTQQSPAIRASNTKLLNASGSPAGLGEIGFLTVSFKNVLAATTAGLEITISETSAAIDILKSTVRPGVILAGGTFTNSLSPFEIQLAASVPDNFSVPLTISYTDGAYIDQEVVTFILNPTYIDVDENLVTTTVSGRGRIGFEDPDASTPTKGVGFVFDGNSLLYEMGVMMGTGTGALLFNNVRATGGAYDDDFVSIGNRIKEITPGDRSTSEIFGTMSNSTAAASQAFQLKYRSMAWREAPYDKFVILEYIVSNPTANPITNFNLGLFADWDITDGGVSDRANWENTLKMGYVFPVVASTKPHVGIQLLTGGAPAYFAIDNDQAIAGNPFGLYDGFSDAEKFQTLSNGLGRLTAGTSDADGNDVSHVVGTGPVTIPAGQEVTIAFALHSAVSLSELILSAKYADSVYNYTLTAARPVTADVNTCYGAPATINASGATSYKWYKNFTGGTPFATGPSVITGNLFNDTTFYVSNAENSFESVRAAAKVLSRQTRKLQHPVHQSSAAMHHSPCQQPMLTAISGARAQRPKPFLSVSQDPTP